MPRATVAAQVDGCWLHSRQKECGYPRKKTVRQTDMWLLRYKPRKSVTTAGRPAVRLVVAVRLLVLILTFLCDSQRDKRALPRPLVIMTYHVSGTSPHCAQGLLTTACVSQAQRQLPHHCCHRPNIPQHLFILPSFRPSIPHSSILLSLDPSPFLYIFPSIHPCTLLSLHPSSRPSLYSCGLQITFLLLRPG